MSWEYWFMEMMTVQLSIGKKYCSKTSTNYIDTEDQRILKSWIERTSIRAKSLRNHLRESGKVLLEQARGSQFQISVVTYMGPISDQYSLPSKTWPVIISINQYYQLISAFAWWRPMGLNENFPVSLVVQYLNHNSNLDIHQYCQTLILWFNIWALKHDVSHLRQC